MHYTSTVDKRWTERAVVITLASRRIESSGEGEKVFGVAGSSAHSHHRARVVSMSAAHNSNFFRTGVFAELHISLSVQMQDATYVLLIIT